MALAPSIIREEHRSLSAVIKSLGLLAREARDRRIEPDYERRMASDLASRSIHPMLAQNFISALREAGIGRTARSTGTLRS